MSLSWDEVLQVLRIIQESDVAELHVELGDLKISLNTAKGFPPGASIQGLPPGSQGGKVAVHTELPQDPGFPVAAVATSETAGVEAGLVPIKASILGTFYRRPAPDQPPFVEVGSEVNEGTVVCLIEVMKLFNSIQAGVRGRIEKICVRDAQLVEYGQTLFFIRPMG